MTPVRLTDGVVVLRALLPTDVDDITEACQDPETQRWTTVPVPYTREHSVEFVANHGTDSVGWREGRNPVWVITEAGHDHYGGAIDLRLDGDGGAEVGYALAPRMRGKGHMQRALRLACTWAFTEGGVAHVIWFAHVGNEASRRTAEAVGFRSLDGVLRQHCVSRGVRHDSWVADLLPGDLL